MNTLLPSQKEHADNIAVSVALHRVALDVSNPGTGKTYVACSVAARLGKPVFIITTKATAPRSGISRSVISDLLAMLNLPPYEIEHVLFETA